MFKYKSVAQQLREERTKNEKLRAKQRKLEADTEYIAMMCDVELEMEKMDNMEDISENEPKV